MPARSGLVSASVLAMILLGVFSGAVVGLVLSSGLTNQIVLAIITAFVAVVLALLVGHRLLGSQAQPSSRSPAVLWNVVIASLIGGLAGHELSVDLRSPPSSALVGALSGLLASILITSFVVTVFWLNARQPGD